MSCKLATVNASTPSCFSRYCRPRRSPVSAPSSVDVWLRFRCRCRTGAGDRDALQDGASVTIQPLGFCAINTRKLTPSKAESALLEPFIGLPMERIYVPVSAVDFAQATAAIKAAGVAGFDTESKPVFDRGVVSDGPHVVQFALENCAFLFQPHRPECRPFLAELLQSQAVLKVGFDLKSDRGQIHAKLGVALGAVLDLNLVFRADGHRNTTGVRAAVALVFNQKFHKSKAVTTSNWSVHTLSPKQLLYAANDAYAALCVLTKLNRAYDDLPIAGLTAKGAVEPLSFGNGNVRGHDFA